MRNKAKCFQLMIDHVGLNLPFVVNSFQDDRRELRKQIILGYV